MNNWLKLNNSQIEKIKSKVSSFDDDEVQFFGCINYCDQSHGDFDKAYSLDIQFLEIKILNKYFTLINNCEAHKNAIIDLTDEQYDAIKNILLKHD